VSDDQCTAVVQVAFAPELAREYGAPQVAYLRIEVGAAKDDTARADLPPLPVMNLSLTLWNKTSTRLPEATWFNFKTAPPAGSGTAPRWEMNKLSSWIDPMTVVDGGNQYQHGVHTGVRSGGLTVETLDAILVAPITAQPAVRETCPGTQAQPARYEGNCKDIWCTWQGTPTALPGGGTRGAGLAPLPKVVGMGYNLHNNKGPSITLCSHPTRTTCGVAPSTTATISSASDCGFSTYTTQRILLSADPFCIGVLNCFDG
jgi:hypothetical protein